MRAIYNLDIFSELKVDDSDIIDLPSESVVQKVLNSAGPYGQYAAKPEAAKVTTITSNLFLTGAGGLTIESFQEFQPTHILNITEYIPKIRGFKTLKLCVVDDPSQSIYPILIEGSDWIHKQFEAHPDARVLVHCQAGMSRSPSTILAYLIRFKKMSLRTAFDMVVTKRPIARPNCKFFSELLTLEEEVLGAKSGSLILIEKNNRILEMPSFRPYDQPNQFKDDFEDKLNIMNDIKPEEIEDRIVISLDRTPNFFKETPHSSLLG